MTERLPHVPVRADAPPERVAIVLVLVAALVGLVASAILLADYVGAAPVFCDAAGGCAVVRQSAFAHVGGVPTPLWGVIGFATLALLAATPGRGARRLLVVTALGGAVGALGLIYIQHRIGAYCRFCLVADGAMLVVAATVLGARRRLAAVATPPQLRSWVAGAALLAVAAPFAVAALRRPSPLPPASASARPLPPVIAAEMARTPRGRVTVVEFVDYECPYCRINDAALGPVLAARRDRVRLVRKQMPLTSIHTHALAAARAACCADALGHGDELSTLLFAAPVEQLTSAGCEALAARAGVELSAYRACLASGAADTRLADDATAFAAAGGAGLPTLWIDGRELVGAQSSTILAAALDAALPGS
jgi:protein-disulfide isomerase